MTFISSAPSYCGRCASLSACLRLSTRCLQQLNQHRCILRIRTPHGLFIKRCFMGYNLTPLIIKKIERNIHVIFSKHVWIIWIQMRYNRATAHGGCERFCFVQFPWERILLSVEIICQLWSTGVNKKKERTSLDLFLSVKLSVTTIMKNSVSEIMSCQLGSFLTEACVCLGHKLFKLICQCHKVIKFCLHLIAFWSSDMSLGMRFNA